MTSRPHPPSGATSTVPGTPTTPSSPTTSVPRAVTVSVNGAPREVPGDCTLDRLVATLTSAPSGVAAAVNETVVPRGQWAEHRVRQGDRIEVLTAVQGG